MMHAPKVILALLTLPLASLFAAADHPVDPGVDLATVAGTATAHHTITEPGSYFLSGDLEVTKQTGINVLAAGVTLDLNGFAVRRVSGAGGDGILIAVTADECVITNGVVAGFAYGARAFSADGGYFNLRVRNCAFAGLVGGDHWLIVNCDASDNPKIAITTGDKSSLVYLPSGFEMFPVKAAAPSYLQVDL